MILTLYDWLNKLHNVYMAAIVGIISRYGLGIEETSLITVSIHCISCSFHFNTYLKQLYISKKTEHFSNKSGHGVSTIKAFKRRAGLGYRQTGSGY